ncbi:MAG: bifunctional indole-3-glycerol phosphate synthase/phosphoribosylanthranilate isomerase [Spirochaetales bacterium]|nr:bifunctional indole-3-glycerol phosphate synthase/phosphoribosylanthranilate isomerase [Spirochaetales bacterium]
MKILTEIINKRKQLISEKGHCQGETVPADREYPLVPFPGNSALICEVKRKSPSRKNIDMTLDPVNTARIYTGKGVQNISVLTEPHYFGGSLNDLMKIKAAFPKAAVLRKDFLIDREDIDIAWRAGADAVLLIAAAHDTGTLADLYGYARGKGLSVLFEVHDRDDLRKAAAIKPELLGINTRDLRTFIIDPTVPLRLAEYVDWPCRLVFESGIHSGQQASFAAACGASALLVGESVVKNPELIGAIQAGFSSAGKAVFWQKLFSRNNMRPFVKICGITRTEDLLLADSLGADIAGMIFADSPRKVSIQTVLGMPPTRALKAGVIVVKNGKGIPDEVLDLYDRGVLDVLQIHGRISENLLPPGNADLYQAASVKDEQSLLRATDSNYPRVLLEAFVPGLHGGTGKLLDDSLVQKAAASMPLWLAGGLNPDNITRIIRQHRPELVDASSGLESSPGIKDHTLMKTYFQNIQSTMEQKDEMV